MSERYMQELQELHACSHCGWWGAGPRSHDWAGEPCHVEGCSGKLRRGTFALVAKAERDRYREALWRIADGDVDGVGDHSDCVQSFARAALVEHITPKEEPKP